MEAFFILLGLGALFCIFVLPIIAIVTAARARRETERLDAVVREQALTIGKLGQRLTEALQGGTVRTTSAPAPTPPTATAAPAPAVAPVAPPPSARPAAAPPAPLVTATVPKASVLPAPPPVPELPKAPVLEPAAAVSSISTPASLPPADTTAPAAASSLPPPLPASAVAAAMADAKQSAGFAGETAAAATPKTAAPPPSAKPTASAVPLPPPAAPAPSFNWEQFLGVKALAWVAGFAFFLGAVYLLILSVQNQWISQEVQAGMIFLAGGGLVVGGVWADRRGYRAGGQSLIATGVVVLYAVTFACRSHYQFDLFANPLVPFSLMALITTAAFLLAVRLKAQVVVILGLLGGFLTPPMVASGNNNWIGLFSYISFLNLGLLAVALRCRWHHLVLLAAIGTTVLEVGWASEYFNAHALHQPVIVVCWFAVLFPAALAVARRWSAVDDWLASGAVLMPLVAAGFAAFFLTNSTAAGQPLLVFTTILVADLALLALALLHAPLLRLQLPAGIGAMALAAAWIVAGANDSLLPWALGLVLLLAVIHVGFPFVAQRVYGALPPSRAAASFPAIALIVLFIPVLTSHALGSWLWPVALLLDLLAIVAAAITGALAAVAGVVVLTLVLLACAILQLPAPLESGAGMEPLLVAGFALLFCGASFWLVRRVASGKARADSAADSPAWMEHLPAFSAAMPFALLVLLLLKLSLPDPSEVFGVGLLLTGLLLGLAALTRRGGLALVALLGVTLLEHVWHAKDFTRGDSGTALAWYLGFALLFTLFPFALRRRLLPVQGPWAAAALALPLHFLLIFQATMPHWPEDMKGLIALLAAIPPLLGLVVLVRSIPHDAPYRLNRLAWFGGTTLFFVTLVFPLQFSNQWLTVSWALEGVALVWLFHRIPHPGLRAVGVGLLTAVFVRLMFNPFVLEYHVRGETPIFNWILYTYGISAAACFAAARLLAPPRDRVLGLSVPVLLQVGGALLTFALLNLEIADFFTAPGARPELAITGSFERDMVYPILWSAFALGLLWIGIRREAVWARLGAALLFGATFLRLLVHEGVYSYRDDGLPAWLAATFGFTIAALFVAGYWYRVFEGKAFGIVAPRIFYRILGTVLLFVFVNLQIAERFTAAGLPLDLHFSGHLARDMTYTISWSIFALVILIYGFWKHAPGARYSAIALFGITLGKLFFVDLANLSNIWRVGAFMGVAAVLFAATFLYQRFFGVEKKSP